MNRREAISRVALILGTTVIGGELFLSGCRQAETTSRILVFNPDQITLLNEVGETILPATASSAGAKAANVGKFMQTMVRDCYSPEEQETFMDGLGQLNAFSRKVKGKVFLDCNVEERKQVLISLDDEAKTVNKKNGLLKQQELEKEKASQAGGKPNYVKKNIPDHYFSMIRQLSLLGFFTSEIGYKAQGYVSVPGRYDGDERGKVV